MILITLFLLLIVNLNLFIKINKTLILLSFEWKKWLKFNSRVKFLRFRKDWTIKLWYSLSWTASNDRWAFDPIPSSFLDLLTQTWQAVLLVRDQFSGSGTSDVCDDVDSSGLHGCDTGFDNWGDKDSTYCSSFIGALFVSDWGWWEGLSEIWFGRDGFKAGVVCNKT